MTNDEIRHLISYFKRMIEQMLSFLDEAEKKLPKEDFHKHEGGQWP